MPDQVIFNGPVQAGAISFGDNQPVTGTLHVQQDPDHDDTTDGPAEGDTVVADSVEFGPAGPIIRGQR